MNTTARAQPGVPTSAHLDIPIVPEEERLGFSVREFTRNWGLDARKGGGAHMWREIWNEDVSTIYKDILRESPRVYLCFNLRSLFALVQRGKNRGTDDLPRSIPTRRSRGRKSIFPRLLYTLFTHARNSTLKFIWSTKRTIS